MLSLFVGQNSACIVQVTRIVSSSNVTGDGIPGAECVLVRLARNVHLNIQICSWKIRVDVVCFYRFCCCFCTSRVIGNRACGPEVNPGIVHITSLSVGLRNAELHSLNAGMPLGCCA